MNQIIRNITQRMSLRKPQQDALRHLEQIVNLLPLKSNQDTSIALESIQKDFPQVLNFEREFPNFCFSLATGVGKTRLMGAMIAYLASAKGIRHFFILAPNNTILEKLVREFSNPNDPKYVFNGLGEFSNERPQIITADNFDQGVGVRNRWSKAQDFLKGDEIHINIFNIAMIHSQDGRIRDKRETIQGCMSYFEYLSKREDLVMFMDEAHRYRAPAATRAINELNPLLGIELTATPQVEKGNQSVQFKNIVYNYSLAEALHDGFVKVPWVAGRANFQSSNYTEESLEKLKIEDGVRIHESTKIYLDNYAYEEGLKPIKPFMLIIAQSMAHANQIENIIKSPDFFNGHYLNKTRVVHSGNKADEEERMVKDLLEIENFDNPTEIVIHVNMLKEGWDVKNLYTIVPLRAANSKTLIEQSLGRGLRLPFGKRTGVEEVDRLTIVSHDKFKDIVDEAKKTGSIIRSALFIGDDIPFEGFVSVDVTPKVSERFESFNPEERAIVQHAIGQAEEIGLIKKEELIQKLQKDLPDQVAKEQIKSIAERVIDKLEESLISIPRIVLMRDVVKLGRFHKFTLDLKHIHPQSIDHSILFQNLDDGTRKTQNTEMNINLGESPEDYIARHLLDSNDIEDNEDNTEVVLDLGKQLISHLRTYLNEEADIHNVVSNYRDMFVKLIHNQMKEHYENPEFSITDVPAKGFHYPRTARYTTPVNQPPIQFDLPLEDKASIKTLLFTGFRKSQYNLVKFDSDSERLFSIILENDPRVIKWLKPTRKSVPLFYNKDEIYEPDFVVETHDKKFICEVKRRCDLDDQSVIDKADAAARWCSLATKHAKFNEDKPWEYLLIPHDALDITMLLSGLETRYTCDPQLMRKP